MACFLVPVAEAIITTIAEKAVKAREDRRETAAPAGETTLSAPGKIPFSRKLKWLNGLLWGGSALLAFEHLWHGGVVPWFPFLTAAADPADAAAMLHEMFTVGVAMAATVTVVWAIMAAVVSRMEKKAALNVQPSEG